MEGRELAAAVGWGMERGVGEMPLPSALRMNVNFMAKDLGGHRKVLEVFYPFAETLMVL